MSCQDAAFVMRDSLLSQRSIILQSPPIYNTGSRRAASEDVPEQGRGAANGDAEPSWACRATAESNRQGKGGVQMQESLRDRPVRARHRADLRGGVWRKAIKVPIWLLLFPAPAHHYHHHHHHHHHHYHHSSKSQIPWILANTHRRAQCHVSINHGNCYLYMYLCECTCAVSLACKVVTPEFTPFGEQTNTLGRIQLHLLVQLEHIEPDNRLHW
ncbi:unnamed protein product [Periconia digitata]|uniref:Uncharacterized protein n=1 Tax=Periconia digitata TaxID=1303443 RepID=A0A9W4XSG4_9PLEO|nr:unnamed protein product [Periconia digitata]